MGKMGKSVDLLNKQKKSTCLFDKNIHQISDCNSSSVLTYLLFVHHGDGHTHYSAAYTVVLVNHMTMECKNKCI